MSKKELIKFGIKGIDAFQDNYKIFFDRLVRGYRSMMGKDPEGLDLLKVKMEARDKAMQTTKVVNMKGKTLDPNKPITGGTQEGIETIEIKELDDFNLSKDDPMGDLEKIVKGEGDTGLPKNYTRPFGDNIRDAYGKAGRSREEATEMVEALNSPGAKSSYQIMEETLGVRLYGDETFEELMKIKETGVHPRGEPPIKKADGGRIGLRYGGDTMGGPNDKSVQQAADNRDRGRTEQYSRPSAPRDLGFIGSGPTVNPNLTKKGPNIISAPNPDPRFAGYTPSTFDPGGQNIFQKGFNLVKKTVTNPFIQTFGINMLAGPLGLTKQLDMINKARAIKNLYENLGPIADQSMQDVLEEETGQTTALYKDGGLVTLFTEKR